MMNLLGMALSIIPPVEFKFYDYLIKYLFLNSIYNAYRKYYLIKDENS